MPDGKPEASDSLLAFERDALARDLRESVARRDALSATVEALSREVATLRSRADAAEARLADAVEDGAADPEREATLRRLSRERRDLLADLAEAQARLAERSDELVALRCGRAHRAATVVWGLRRRPVRAAALLGCAALLPAAALLAALAFGIPWPVAAVAAAAGFVAASFLVRADWRARTVQQQRWAMRLRAGDARVLELHDGDRPGGEPAPAPAPAPAPEPAPAPAAAPPEPEPAAAPPAPEPAAAPPAAKVRIERRLVPSLAAAPGGELLAGGPLDPRRVRVAAILDEISEACLAPECDLRPLTRSAWAAQLDEYQPHLLLVESAWSGSGGAWQDAIASQPSRNEPVAAELCDLVAACRERGIPSVFWNTEDPVQHERFAGAAALFDHVLTADGASVGRYAELPGERTVGVLPFAAQPRLHHPIAAAERVQRAAFAGAYHRERDEARRAELDLVLDAARPFGLDIYDRMLGSDSEAFGFPERFRPHVRGRLSYAEIGEAYRRHALFLNVNSVTESPTKCSRRVFELLACDTPVVSTPSRAFGELLTAGVAVVDSLEDATAQIDRLLHDPAHRRAVALQGRREVLARHTYAHRFAEILRVAGFEARDPTPRAGILLLADSTAAAGRTLASVGAAAGRVREVVIGVPADVPLDGPLDVLAQTAPALSVRLVHQADGLGERERMRELAALAQGPWVAPLRGGVAFRGEDLDELLACTTYAHAEVIGGGDPRGALRAPEQSFVADLDPTFTLAARDRVASIGWPGASGLSEWSRRGMRLYRAGTVTVQPDRDVRLDARGLRSTLRRRARR